MTEQKEAIRDLTRAGVLAGIRWAWGSACRYAAMDYNPATGHDQALLGLNAHKLFKDRLDRVFSCLKYSVQDPADDQSGLDVLVDGLLPEEAEVLLALRSNDVERADRTFSPGWRYNSWHWLLSAFPPGGVKKIDWRRKSPTKQRVAYERNPDYYDLFTDTGDADSPTVIRSTLIIAHSYDGELGGRELYVGSPKVDPNSGDPWNWLKDLLAEPPSGADGTMPTWPDLPTPGPDVKDAVVRLKPDKDTEAS
jgi:hypothetical protein